MGTRKPPVDETEQLMNLLEGLASLDEAEGPTDDEIRAEMAAQGIDMDAWADAIKAKAEAQLRAEEEKRQERARRRRRKALVGGAIGVALAAAATGVALSGVAMRGAGGPNRVADEPKQTDPVADRPKQTGQVRSRELPVLGDTATSPSVSATADAPDAGPPRAPRRR